MELIDKTILDRTQKAFKCLPLNCEFYKEVQSIGLTAEKVFEMKSKYLTKGFIWFRSHENIESAFIWLIRIGILRREVDGQGLTAKVRLTPLGRQIIKQHPELPNQKATLFERFENLLLRKIRLQ